MSYSTSPRHPAFIELVLRFTKFATKGERTFTSVRYAVLQRHYRQLEAIALEKDCAEEVCDLTASDDSLIRKRVGSLLDEFKYLTNPFSQSDTKGRKQKVINVYRIGV